MSHLFLHPFLCFVLFFKESKEKGVIILTFFFVPTITVHILQFLFFSFSSSFKFSLLFYFHYSYFSYSFFFFFWFILIHFLHSSSPREQQQQEQKVQKIRNPFGSVLYFYSPTSCHLECVYFSRAFQFSSLQKQYPPFVFFFLSYSYIIRIN